MSKAFTFLMRVRRRVYRCCTVRVISGSGWSGNKVGQRENEMGNTYRAVEVATPGVLRLVERQISKPAAGQVRLRVEACGVCHCDLATVQGDYPGLKLPRVPGHEVVGRIEEIGPNVSKWKVGQRVGVGFLGGRAGECEPCLRGDFANCLDPVISGITTDGGYAEVMIAEARAPAAAAPRPLHPAAGPEMRFQPGWSSSYPNSSCPAPR